jgi:hypothetical protein
VDQRLVDGGPAYLAFEGSIHAPLIWHRSCAGLDLVIVVPVAQASPLPSWELSPQEQVAGGSSWANDSGMSVHLPAL